MNNANTNLWQVFDYELQMYFETRSIYESLKSTPKDLKGTVINNTLIESMVLQTRIMVDLLISKGREKDDIKLKDLLPKWCESEKGIYLTNELELAYGKADVENSPCRIFNKMLAHPTSWRGSSYNYYPALKKVGPHVLAILREIVKTTSSSMLEHYLTKQ